MVVWRERKRGEPRGEEREERGERERKRGGTCRVPHEFFAAVVFTRRERIPIRKPAFHERAGAGCALIRGSWYLWRIARGK